MKTVIIAGDSWGCGEWRTIGNDYHISHRGLAAYLLTHDPSVSVINLSQPGGSNRITASYISNFLRTNTHLQISHIVVFQTEWIRDLEKQNPIIIDKDLSHGYIGLKNRLISKFYGALSASSIKYDVPIQLIGGCSDTLWFDNFKVEYPGVNTACQSLTNMLLKNNHRNPDPVYSIFTKTDQSVIDYIKQRISPADLELLLTDIDKGQDRLCQWKKNLNFFYPDGGHPNRTAHKVLYNYLKDNKLL
jgi:hypothetical protein